MVRCTHPSVCPSRYAETLKCQGVNLTNTNEYYARYTTSFICNGLVQSSKDDCNLSDNDSRPLCASSCVSDDIRAVVRVSC